MEKPLYTLRDLRAEDLFAMLRILNKIGVGDAANLFHSAEIKDSISAAKEKGAEGDALLDAVGVKVTIRLVELLISSLPECEKELYAFLASLSGMKAKDIAALPMGTFIDMLMELFRKDEFRDFFQRAAGSLKSENNSTLI